MNLIKLAFSFWKEILIALLIGSTVMLWQMNSVKAERIGIISESLDEKNKRLEKAEGKLDTIAKATESANIAYQSAEVKRLEVISKMASEINIIRLQQPPKDCQKAVEWSILRKDDLSWPKP